MRVYEGIWGYIRVYEAHIGYFLQGGKIGCFASLFLKVDPSCGQTVKDRHDFSIELWQTFHQNHSLEDT